MLHGDLLGERARLTPGKVALVDVASGARFSYADLDARARRCARMMRSTLGSRACADMGRFQGKSRTP